MKPLFSAIKIANVLNYMIIDESLSYRMSTLKLFDELGPSCHRETCCLMFSYRWVLGLNCMIWEKLYHIQNEILDVPNNSSLLYVSRSYLKYLPFKHRVSPEKYPITLCLSRLFHRPARAEVNKAKYGLKHANMWIMDTNCCLEVQCMQYKGHRLSLLAPNSHLYHPVTLILMSKC